MSVSPRSAGATAAAAAFAELVAVMDRLRSPGGCPWDAEQTHASLAPYAIEEAYEVAEAAERGDPEHLREELGDLLLQVVFHARIAQEGSHHAFDVADVVHDLVDKLRRRHPHVFGGLAVSGVGEVVERWAQIKEAEKPQRALLDGVPLALPALARAQKVLSRARSAGSPEPAPPARGTDAGADIGDRLLALVAEARDRGVDAEGALRAAVVRHAERPPAPAGGPGAEAR